MTIRPVFFPGTFPFCGVCPRKFLTSNATSFCLVFYGSSRFCPDFRILKKYLWLVNNQEDVMLSNLLPHNYAFSDSQKNSPNCMQNLGKKSRGWHSESPQSERGDPLPNSITPKEYLRRFAPPVLRRRRSATPVVPFLAIRKWSP